MLLCCLAVCVCTAEEHVSDHLHALHNHLILTRQQQQQQSLSEAEHMIGCRPELGSAVLTCALTSLRRSFRQTSCKRSLRLVHRTGHLSCPVTRVGPNPVKIEHSQRAKKSSGASQQHVSRQEQRRSGRQTRFLFFSSTSIFLASEGAALTGVGFVNLGGGAFLRGSL